MYWIILDPKRVKSPNLINHTTPSQPAQCTGESSGNKRDFNGMAPMTLLCCCWHWLEIKVKFIGTRSQSDELIWFPLNNINGERGASWAFLRPIHARQRYLLFHARAPSSVGMHDKCEDEMVCDVDDHLCKHDMQSECLYLGGDRDLGNHLSAVDGKEDGRMMNCGLGSTE